MSEINKYFPITSKLSSLAYQEPADIESELKKDDFENFKWIENTDTDTQAFMCSRNKNSFLSFRGTEFDSIDDWKTNLDCGLVPFSFGRLHKGFFNDSISVYPSIQKELVKHIIKGRDLIITGHSQGGGDAAAVAGKMISENRKIQHVITFGQPRTMDGMAAGYLDAYFPDIFHRVVNNNDIVTRIPPRIMAYKHFGNLHYFKEDGEYTTDISWWARFIDRVHGRIDDIGEWGTDGIKDHPMINYVNLIKKSFGET